MNLSLKQFLDILERGNNAMCLWEGSEVRDLDQLFGIEITDSEERDFLVEIDRQLDDGDDWVDYEEEYLEVTDKLVDDSIKRIIGYLTDNISFEESMKINPINGYILNKIAKMCRDDRESKIKRELKNAIYDSKNDFLSDKEIKEYHVFKHQKYWYDCERQKDGIVVAEKYAPYYEIDGVGLHGRFVEFDMGEEPLSTVIIDKEISADIKIDDSYNPPILEIFGIK